MNKELFMRNLGGVLRGWKIKLGEDEYWGKDSIGFDLQSDDFLNSYCVPLTDDTPEFASFIFQKNYPTWYVDRWPQFSHYPFTKLKADKGIFYREDNPSIIYPAIYKANDTDAFTLLNTFYPIFLNNGETIDDIIGKEYTIIYDPDRQWKPTTKLTVSCIQDTPNDDDESGKACFLNSNTPLADFNTLIPVTENYKIGSTHELALNYNYFWMQMSYEGTVHEAVNCEQVDYFSQYGMLFKVLNMSKDVSLVYSTYDPT